MTPSFTPFAERVFEQHALKIRPQSAVPNGASRRAKIVEKNNGSVTNTKQFVSCAGETQPCEERDGSNNVTNWFYAQGEQIRVSSYYYSRDHLGSIRELTDSTGAIRVLSFVLRPHGS
jgi:hypothetical protein